MNKPELPEDIKMRLADEVALFVFETGVPLMTVVNFTTKIARITADAHSEMLDKLIEQIEKKYGS